MGRAPARKKRASQLLCALCVIDKMCDNSIYAQCSHFNDYYVSRFFARIFSFSVQRNKAAKSCFILHPFCMFYKLSIRVQRVGNIICIWLYAYNTMFFDPQKRPLIVSIRSDNKLSARSFFEQIYGFLYPSSSLSLC